MNVAKASVIIPTYNGAHRIETVLKALAAQTEKSFEVIVVIDGSSDNTLQVLERHKMLLPDIRIHVQDNQGRSGARNKGVLLSASPVLIFYDDDMEPEPESVEKHLAFHRQFDGIVSGYTVEEENGRNTDIQNYKSWLSKKWLNKFPDALCRLDAQNLFFTAANSSITRKCFDRLGGFDIRLTDAEDHDLALRCMSMGIPVYYDKTNRAYHHDLISCASYIQRLRAYGRAQVVFKAMHRDLYPEKTKSKTASVKKLIYRFFATEYWVRMIDRNSLKWLPKKIRFKLYDIVIQSLAVEYPERSI